MSPVRIVHYGLGSIGLGIAEILVERGYEIVGAVDIAPAKAGRPLADLLPSAPGELMVERSSASILHANADVAIHATQSRLTQILDQVTALIEARLNVISTCEELAFPWYHSPHVASTLDEMAKARGVTVAGLGVNPGFLMDALPVILTAPCREIRNITVHRVVDVGARRFPLQRKVGVGLTREEFERGVAAGRIAHVGLPQSVAMIAQVLGWNLEGIEETIQPVIAADGTVRGLHQVCRGVRSAAQVITLDLTIAAGVDHPRDAIIIDGIPSVQMEISGGIHGDQGTCAIVANAIPAVLAAPPGLLVPTQLALHHVSHSSQSSRKSD